MEQLARETLPNGICLEWTDLTYQQRLAGTHAHVSKDNWPNGVMYGPYQCRVSMNTKRGWSG